MRLIVVPILVTLLMTTVQTHLFVSGLEDSTARLNTTQVELSTVRPSEPDLLCPSVITFGEVYQCSIDAPAEIDMFTFDGTLNDILRIKFVRTSGLLVLKISVTRPSGSTICGPTTDNEFNCQLDEVGTYKLVVQDNSGANTGSYSFYTQRLNDPVGCAVIDYGSPPTTGSIDLANEFDCYTFDATTNDILRLKVIETGGTLYLTQEIVDPDGITECSETYYGEYTCTLNKTGTFTLLIRDNVGTNTGTYTIYLQRLNNPVGCAAIDYGSPPTTGSIDLANEFDCYTFAASTNDILRLKVIETGGTLYLTQEIVDPDGITECSETYYGEYTCTVNKTGTFTLLIRDNVGTNTGSYTIYLQRLNDPVGCAAIEYGSPPTTGSIDLANEFDCYTFAASTNDILRLKVIETGGTLYLTQEIVDPDGITECSETYYGEYNCTLNKTGTFTLLIRDNVGTNTGTYTIYLQRLNNPVGCATIYFGVPKGGSIDLVNEFDCYTFKASQNAQVVSSVVETGGTLYVSQEIVDPDGDPLCGETYSNDMNCDLNKTGFYTLLIRDNSGHNTGSYQISLTCLSTDCGGETPPPPKLFFIPVVMNNYIRYFPGPWEVEDNDIWTQANGFLYQNQDYYGYPDDQRDWFSFLSTQPGSLEVSLSGHTGQDVQLHVYYQVVDASHRVCYVGVAPYECNINVNAGIYYILIYTESGFNTTTPYTLRVASQSSGSALSFDGVDDWVSLPNSLIETTNILTIEAWFKTSSSGVIIAYQNSAIWGSPSNYTPLVYVGIDGKLRGEFWNGQPVSPVTSNALVNDGSWHHVALVGNADTQSLYLDGELAGSQSGYINHLNQNHNQLGIGFTGGDWPGSNGSWFPFNGVIDEVRIWNIARSQADIQSTKDHPLNGSEAGLVAYYRLDEGGGTSVGDSSNHGNSGQLGGGVSQPQWFFPGFP